MNFRHLNEAFNRLNEKALNEGPGAGYTIKGTTIIKVDNVKVLSKEDNEYDTTYEVSFNGRGNADIEFASYYYGDSLEDVPVVATKAYVDVDTDDINNGYTVEQYIESLFYNEELKIDLLYGGGWSHSTYDGTVASEEYPAENTYADIVITDMKITDEDIIRYIDDVVQGNYEDDDYFEESLSDDIRKGNLDYDDEIDAHYKKNGNIEVQFQDRNSNMHVQRNPKDRSSKFEKQPRVSSHTWGRIWKDGNLVKSVEDSKYGARQEIAKYLDDNSMGESLKESEDITYTPKVRRFKSVDGTNRIINQYYEEPNYPNWGKGERNKKEISDDEYNRFLQTGKLKEDASKEWKPNTSFAHIKKIYNDVKKRGYKYVNNELEEMHAAMDKVDARGYTPEQRKQIRSWSEEIWRANRKNESLKESYDDVNSSNAFDVLYDMVELFGCEEMLDALAKAMGTSDLADNLTYICRQYDYDPNPDSVEESLNESNQHKYIGYEDVDENKYPNLKEALGCGGVSLIIYDNNNMYNESFDKGLMKEFGLDPKEVLKEIKDLCRELNVKFFLDKNYTNESLTEEESEDARKFIRKFCNGQWSDDYVNLIIYAMGEVVMADYREDIEDACSEILKSNSENAWVVIEEKLSASDLFEYCYEEFYDDLSTICSNILYGQSVDRAISSYLSTGYNRDKFVQVVKDIISRIDFEDDDDFDLAAEIDSALIYDEDLWSVIEFYLDPDDIINGNGFDVYMSFVNDVEDIMLEYYSTEDKNESLTEENGKKRKTLYFVTQSVWGADKPTRLYFETKEEANKYYETHNYVDKPKAVRVTDEHAKELLELTCFDMDESLTESTSRKEREKAYNDLKKFIVKFCNVEWSDEYMDLVIYAVLNSNANVKSNYMNIEDTCSNMLGAYPYAWSTLKEHFGDKQTRYLLGYFVNDVKDIMSKYYSKDESLTEERGNYGHKGPFWYYSKHGMGPGTIPKDVNVVDWYEDDNYNTWIALDGVLTTQELREYELKEQKPPIEGV